MNAAPGYRKRRRWPWGVLAVLVIAVLAAWLATYALRGGGDRGAASPIAATPELVRQGEYLARAGDCVACHTGPSGQPFAGGLAMASPIGDIYSSNITPDKETGIGDWSYGEFERAVRRGIARSGHTLYPAMPYPSYARISDQDMAALYAYFMQGVKPVSERNQGTGIVWPLSMRWPLTYWRLMFSPSPEKAAAATAAEAGQDPVLARGAYLVQGLGHCGSCHTPRALTLQEKALTGQDGHAYLSGGSADNWIAPSLRGEAVSGLGGIDEQAIVTFLKTGRTDETAAFGGMADVVQHSTQYLSDEDLLAIARYLKTLAPAREESQAPDDGAVAQALFAGRPPSNGARIYLDNCATCHRTAGQGYTQVYPVLARNPAVNSADPTSLIHLTLNGGIMPTTHAAPTQFAMPAFGRRLSDQDIAEVLTFVRSSWGNQAPAVEAAQVRKLRARLPEPETPRTHYDPRNEPNPLHRDNQEQAED